MAFDSRQEAQVQRPAPASSIRSHSILVLSDGIVHVWATGPVCRERDELDDSQPKLLGRLAAHGGQVLIVRWSPSGR